MLTFTIENPLNNLKIYHSFLKRVRELLKEVTMMTTPICPPMNFLMSDSFAEKTTCDQLIVMDNVSGLADKSKKFASFQTIARKFNYT